MPQSDALGHEIGTVLDEGHDDRDEPRELERHWKHGSLGDLKVVNEELHPRS